MDIPNIDYDDDNAGDGGDDYNNEKYCDLIFINESYTNELKYRLILIVLFCLISFIICFLTMKFL